jgi:HemY protein
MSPGHPEAALAVARAALDAREFAIARAALTPLAALPTRRVAALMAEIEASQHGDEGRAREWVTRALTARRDPAWTADGFVSDHWLPVSPVSGRLDAFEWKDPLAGDDHAMNAREARHLLDAPRPPPADDRTHVRPALPDMHPRAPDDDIDVRASTVAPRPTTSAKPVVAGEREPAELVEPARAHAQEEPQEPASREEPRARGPRRFAPVPIPPAVIPLVHAPDDPGPEPDRSAEPAPDHGEPQPPDSWARIRQLFRP